MPHTNPIFILDAKYIKELHGRMLGWKAIHLHDDYVLVSGSFKDHESENYIKSLPSVDFLPNVLQASEKVRNSHIEKLSHVGVNKTHNSLDVRNLMRKKFHKDF